MLVKDFPTLYREDGFVQTDYWANKRPNEYPHIQIKGLVGSLMQD
jgi:transcription-repair coupling factor (superfamily II helicase)